MSARHLLSAAVTAALLVSPAAAQASKKRPKARVSAAPIECANTGLLPTAENVELVRDAVLCLHNQIRREHNLPLLKENSRLRKAGTTHSNEMVDEGYFDHTAPDGTTFVDRILGSGYAKRNGDWTIGENLAWGTGELSTPAGVMQAWMNSAGHKANILKRSYKELGIGIRLGVPDDAGVGATFTADFGAKG
jgi:uncharacterized protein YkwD